MHDSPISVFENLSAFVDAWFGRNDEGILLGLCQVILPPFLGFSVARLSRSHHPKLEQHEKRVALVVVQASKPQLAHLVFQDVRRYNL